MFTGIVEGQATVTSVTTCDGLLTIIVELPTLSGPMPSIGGSVAIDGVCLTVVAIDHHNALHFDLIRETQQLTTLGALTEGQRVNFERSATFMDAIGGHIVSGHVHGRAQIDRVQRAPADTALTLRILNPDLMKYVYHKGFVALDGVSLTVVDLDAKDLLVGIRLIPETLRVTTFGWKSVGDYVNVEVDQMTRTIVDRLDAITNTRGGVAQ